MPTTAIPGHNPAPTKHAKLIAWVAEVAARTQPARVHWCDGSQEEWDTLTSELVKSGAGTLVLGAVNSYQGITHVTEGTLGLEAAGALPATRLPPSENCICAGLR